MASSVKLPKLPKAYWLDQRWGELRLDQGQEGLPEKWAEQSNRKFAFICTCGREPTTKVFRKVTTGEARSCGKCSCKPREYWLVQRWGKLRLDPEKDLPEEWSQGTHRKFSFICDCTRPHSMGMYKTGRDTSCGKCAWMPKEHWLEQRWGRLKLDPNQDLPKEWSPSSAQKFWFICSNDGCIRRAYYTMDIVQRRNQTCGKCLHKSKERWLAQEWGTLKLDPNQVLPDEWGPGYHKKLNFICSKELGGCGRSAAIQMYAVFECKTCGACSYLSKKDWLDKRWGTLRLDENQELPDEWSGNGNKKFYFICECPRHLEGEVNRKKIGIYNVVTGKTKSLGCLLVGRNRFAPESEVRGFVKSLDSDTAAGSSKIWEGSKHEYDVYIPTKKFAVEYHGLHYHSDRTCKGMPDYDKYKLSLTQKDLLIQIYQDEWKNKNQ